MNHELTAGWLIKSHRTMRLGSRLAIVVDDRFACRYTCVYLDGYKERLSLEQLVPLCPLSEVAAKLARLAELEAGGTPCCERDHNRDGDCDRHPPGTLAERVEELEAENERLRAS